MALDSIFGIAGTALNAQLTRMNATASNLANAGTMAGTEAEAFRAKRPVFKALVDEQMASAGSPYAGGVQIERVIDDPASPRLVFGGVVAGFSPAPALPRSMSTSGPSLPAPAPIVMRRRSPLPLTSSRAFFASSSASLAALSDCSSACCTPRPRAQDSLAAICPYRWRPGCINHRKHPRIPAPE